MRRRSSSAVPIAPPLARLLRWKEARQAPFDHALDADQMRAAVHAEVPEEGWSDAQIVEYLRKLVFDLSMYPGHPGFMAYIGGAGTVPGAIADLVAAGINQNVGGWRLGPAATEIELALTSWLAARFGLPDGAGGLMVSGGSVANFVGLKVGRDVIGGHGLRASGLAGRPQMVLYTSEEVHFATTRAADMLGLGFDAVRLIPADDDYKLDVAATERRIEADLEAGVAPFAVVASAGTVATGAVDPLGRIGDLCERYGLWFHVDAAYGGPAVLSDELRPLLEGIERADSIALDPHKWMYTPHSGGCLLVRDLDLLRQSFAPLSATYIHEDKERTGRGIDLGMLGPQLSRGFWALKVWISLLAHGTRAYGRRISHDATLARYLARRAEERSDFELVAPVELSICCFRYVPSDLSGRTEADDYLSALNERLMAEVQLDGRTYYSNAVLGGNFVLRACIVNFRTEAAHIDHLLDVTAEIGARIDEEIRPDELRSRPSLIN
ncbi:MAG: pyridoxal phosphate-dependent decarboxylase family protein [Actinomycetota bacterium]